MKRIEKNDAAIMLLRSKPTDTSLIMWFPRNGRRTTSYHVDRLHTCTLTVAPSRDWKWFERIVK